MANLVSAERVGISYGTTVVMDAVSLGIDAGAAVGVVGRNGSGKSTLLRLLAGRELPDTGRVTAGGSVSIHYLPQADDFAPRQTVRDVIVGGAPDHVWAAEPETRQVVWHFLTGIDLDATIADLSGGERRRVALVAVLLGAPDLLVLDEPTNHLDVEAVDWLTQDLQALRRRGTALVVVSHDRWFLDAVCDRIWGVHDAQVDGYDGGYAAYVLARAERARQAAGEAARRRSLLRKELAWLRRGAPARTAKPKFRVEAATALIGDEPPPRDSAELQRFATTRLGKDVFELTDVVLAAGDRRLLDRLTWTIGPGERIGLVGANGAGKTSLLRVLAGERAPDGGIVRRGQTVNVGHLSQSVVELPAGRRVLEVVEDERRVTRLASGRDVSAASLLEDFGFRGDRLTRRVGDLSGGERRRLQLLRLLLREPNVLLLDEPTNDLDIDTLTVVEDYLDSWPGTLVVVTHDRYFLERVCDVTYALLGDGRCVHLPGGVEQYLSYRRSHESAADGADTVDRAPARPSSAGAIRRARKDLARIESQLSRLETQVRELHEQMSAAGADHARLTELHGELEHLTAQQGDLEDAWLTLADSVELG